MTDASKTAIALLIDRSGSMDGIKEKAEETINGYIGDQRSLPGTVTVRVSSFDGDFREGLRLIRHHGSVPVAAVPRFVLEPYGNTPLLDAMHAEITDFGRELRGLPEAERPGTVIFVIMTDGMENSSQEFRGPKGWDAVKTIVQRQQDEWGWQIIYLGANQDAVQVGADLGVRKGSSMSYATSDSGLEGTRSAMSNYTASAVAYAAAPDQESAPEFSDEDRERSSK
jgi:hypothetical protein